MSEKKYRFIQWATGTAGKKTLLTITLLCGWRLSFSASFALDPQTAEAQARRADAAWAAAARNSGVEAWMSFYADDAIVLLPQGQLASATEFVRQAVNRLLALPHFSISWRPIDVMVNRSGDLAFVVEDYDLRFDDSYGVPVTDRGRRLETWRKQSDGGWKCIVDTWNLGPAPMEPALPVPAQEQATTAPVQEPASVAPANESATKYGDMPAHYEETIRAYFLEHLKHAESVQYGDISKPQLGYITAITGGLLMRETREYGWTVKAAINAKDSHDSYVGFKIYTFLFRGERMVDARLPLPGDETR